MSDKPWELNTIYGKSTDTVDTDNLWTTTVRKNVNVPVGIAYEEIIEDQQSKIDSLQKKIELLERVVMNDPRLKESYEQEQVVDKLKGDE